MFTIIGLVAVAFGALGLVTLLRSPSYRGKRVVTCPETQQPAGAKINALVAAGTELAGAPRFIISACSRWPERAGCDQACAPQIEASPQETLVRNIVARWYRDRTCLYCGKQIRDLGGAVVPALRGVDGELREWKDVAPEDLPKVLGASMAVCARCDVTESFRREFPELITERPRVDEREPRLPLQSSAVY